ncbi:MAG: hypothetical protein WDN03_15170 [Rhizomicrobium sp.]
MRLPLLYIVCAVLGAVGLVCAAESDWLLAAVMGAGLGVTVALIVHAYPHDIAPPADRRHEASQAAEKSKASART